jgi:DHA2 family multidrug resistance protein
MTIRNAARVHSRLVEGVRPDNPVIARSWGGIDFNSMTSLAKVNTEITRQASMVSYIDAFYALFVVIIIISPLILFMRPPRRKADDEPMTMHMD